MSASSESASAAAASAPAASAVLPVGFRFRPTDEELVTHYLKAKIAGRPHPDLLVISDVDLATCEPWDLPAKSVIKSDDPEWFFFAPRDRPKYPGTRHRSNRSTAAGYWKATGKDRLIRSKTPAGAGTLIGIKKTLVFHRGRAPRGQRTSWIIHEYTATEPNFQSGLNGGFILYRLFNKQDGETPKPDPESPSTSSRGNPSQDDAIASMLRGNTSLSGLSQLTPTKIATDHSMSRLLATVDNKEQTTAQGDAFLEVLAQLPDLQPGQRYDGFGFPSISSPMRPYTDHPFVGNMGEQDFSAYFDSIIAEQDLQDLLLDPAYAKSENKHPTGNAESNTATLVTSTDNSNNNVPFERSWRNSNLDQVLLVQHADDAEAAGCSSGTNILQGDTTNDNHETSAQTSMLYRGEDLGSHLISQYELQAGFDLQMESQSSGALCAASSWTSYPQHLFDSGVEPSRSDMINSNALNGQGGWAAAPSSVPEFINPQHGNAARRIRLVCGVERAASACQPILTTCMESESEGEAGSCYSSGSSSNNHVEDYVKTVSQTKAGNTESRGGGHIKMPAQVDSSSSVEEDMLGVGRAKLLHRGANVKQQRVMTESASSRWATGSKECVQPSRESSSAAAAAARSGCVVRYLLRLAIVVTVLVCVARLIAASLAVKCSSS